MAQSATAAAGNANSEAPEIAWISPHGPYLILRDMNPDGDDVYSYFSLKRFDINVVLSSDGTKQFKSISFADKDFSVVITDNIEYIKSHPSKSIYSRFFLSGQPMKSFYDRLIWYLGHSTPYTEQIKKPSAGAATTATKPENWTTFGGGARKTRRRKLRK
jgi:hypothetical protein